MSDNECYLTKGRILDIISSEGARVHFIGVGGVSMCSLFCLSSHFGIKVSGSDRSAFPLSAALIGAGADIVIGERTALPSDTRLVVYSHAIPDSARERVLAVERGIPTVSRAAYMGAIMECYERRIGVSGSHGKSTVTAMISKIFSDGSLSPTTLCGAALFNSQFPFAIGSLDYLIYEGCEYKNSFLSFSPTLSVFLNMELDHTDFFRDKAALSASFLSAMKCADVIIVNADDAELFALARLSGRPFVTYGSSDLADYKCEVCSGKCRDMQFKVYKKGEFLGVVHLPMLGEFNISNATAAIATTMECGVKFELAASSLSTFSGIGRRLELIGEYEGRRVYYDYAHHPTEIRESIRAIGAAEGRVTVVFRPHTYSRTKGLWSDFCSALSTAHHAIILDIDPVREESISGVSSASLAAEIGGSYCRTVDEAVECLSKTDGAVILMGAAELGDIKKRLTG